MRTIITMGKQRRLVRGSIYKTIMSHSNTIAALLPELADLNTIEWHKLQHAYGEASDVPQAIRNLISSDAQLRQETLWQLFGTIYHQGTLYSATCAAVPFILRILQQPNVADRPAIAELITEISKSAVIDPAKLEATWQWRAETFGEIYELPSYEMAAQEITAYQNVLHCLQTNRVSLQQLANDSDPKVAQAIQTALKHLSDL